MMRAAAEGSMAAGAELQRSVEQEQAAPEAPNKLADTHVLTPIEPVSHCRVTDVDPIADFCETITQNIMVVRKNNVN